MQTQSRTRAETKTQKIKPIEEAHFEFFGPYLGPICITIGLPSVCYALIYACNSQGCLNLTSSPISVPGWPSNTQFFTLEACAVFLAWMALQVILHIVLPGPKAQGTLLSDGSRLTYKFTGLLNFTISMAILIYFGFITNQLNLSWAYDNYIPLLTASILFSFSLSFYLYISSFINNSILAAGGNTGIAIYDFFIGRELNPRIGSLDLKEFCELYPGLIGWAALNLAMAHKQYSTTSHVSISMILVNLFQGIYVFDALYYEHAILTTMDITTDGFGFMLTFGDLAWVPFTYSLQTRLLVDYSPALPPWAIIGLILLKLLGYSAFRGANSQKDAFRRNPKDPKVAHLKTLATKRGTKLIISGWWGIARHINYFGDWVMGWAWCLPVAFGCSIVPYFYVIYFAVLLVHRELRDEAACKSKYGADWDRYCKIVRWKIVPFIY